jgi:hypothetical protein
MAKLTAASEIRNKTLVTLAASQKTVNASQDILNKLKALNDTEDRIKLMKAERRACIISIGGKDEVKVLRAAESQNSTCEELDDLEKQIETTKERLVTFRDAYEKAVRPPASPSA